MMASNADEPCAVSFRNIGKSYGSVEANRNVSFDVRRGDVHAVVGENGAGKSTLMRLLAGAELPDAGQILLGDRPVTLSSTHQAALRGIGMVYQDVTVAPSLTVWENVVLGVEPVAGAFIDRRKALRDVGAMIERYGMAFPVEGVTGRLPPSQQQQVEILRVLYRGCSILILDEPTAVLTPSEVSRLFTAIRLLCHEGKTVLFVSHKLPEIMAIADRVTVMRDGAVVVTAATRSVEPARLAHMIVGRELEPIAHASQPPGEVLLAVEGLTAEGPKGGLADLSFTARAGQIVGIAGVAGNGQSELVAALSGTGRFSGGRVHVGQRPHAVVLDATTQPRDRSAAVRILREAGVAVIPYDRRDTGSAAFEPLWFSILAGRFWHWTTSRFGLLDVRSAKAAARAVVDGFAVKTPSIEASPAQLSGGNLQKFIVGRELSERPTVLIAEDPTRGVDIGSSRRIRQELRRLADGGSAVVVVSTDLDELLEIADHLIVLSRGAIGGRFARAEVTLEALGRAMTAGRDDAARQPFPQRVA